MQSIRKTEVTVLMQEKYKSFIHALPMCHFADASVKVKMEEKYFRANGNILEGILTKANEVVKNVRAIVAGIRGIETFAALSQ
jgi:hypothetical protein